MIKFLITLGIVLIAIGLLWPVLQKTGLGHLPGDFVIEGDNYKVYIPLTSALIISALLSGVLWLIGR